MTPNEPPPSDEPPVWTAAELAEFAGSLGGGMADEPDEPESLDWHADWCAFRDGNLCDCGRPYRPGGIPHGGDADD